jgi:hypothetical protein
LHRTDYFFLYLLLHTVGHGKFVTFSTIWYFVYPPLALITALTWLGIVSDNIASSSSPSLFQMSISASTSWSYFTGRNYPRYDSPLSFYCSLCVR